MKDIKHLWINLANYMLNLYSENDKIITEKIKEDLNLKKDVYDIYGLEGSVLLRYRYSV